MSKRGGPRTKLNASSKNESGASPKAPEGSGDAVLDFLYYDAARVGSFLAQVNAGGHLTGYTEGESVSKGRRRGQSLKLGGHIPIIPGLTGEPLEGSVTYELQPGDTGTQTGSRTYDPFWTNALTFLDFVREEGLVKSNPSKAVIGQFVELTGSPWLIDMKLLQRVMETDTLQTLLLALPNLQDEPLGAALALAIIPLLELGVQVTIASGGHTLWGTLLPSALSATPGDIMLKHGAGVSGAWTVLGILDARPDDPSTALTSPTFEGLPQMMVGLTQMRPVIGRPAHAYGITPLLIFREVSGG